jgi:hypothetical protein
MSRKSYPTGPYILLDNSKIATVPAQICASKELPAPPELVRDSGVGQYVKARLDDKFGASGPAGVVLHVRLEDVKEKSNGQYQSYMGDEELKKLLRFLVGQHTDVVTIVTTPGADRQLCRQIADDINPEIRVAAPTDIDEAIWMMAKASVLIMSRSNFSMLGGIINPNASYTYESWAHFEEVSGTKFGRALGKFRILDWK